jgi:hypothetical protein
MLKRSAQVMKPAIALIEGDLSVMGIFRQLTKASSRQMRCLPSRSTSARRKFRFCEGGVTPPLITLEASLPVLIVTNWEIRTTE